MAQIKVIDKGDEVHLTQVYELTGYSTIGGSYLVTHMRYKEDACQLCLAWPITGNCNNGGCDNA